MFIVPGGGVFADAVRLAHVDDEAAHWMAIAAMEQFGWFIASHGMETTDQLIDPEKSTVFLPYRCLIQEDPLPHNWDITSDTIAGWVAHVLKLDLLLLKSIDGIMISGILQERIVSPIVCDEVDPFFLPFVLKNSIDTTIINASRKGRLKRFLNGIPVPGTRIGTTF
jgi:hypothetical protein